MKRRLIALVLGIAMASGPVRLSASTEITVHLRTSGNYYVVADSGSYVKADRTSANAWETFTLVDLNGGNLESGDEVAFRTYNGTYMWVDFVEPYIPLMWNSGVTSIGSASTFTLYNLDNLSATIGNGTHVGLWSDYAGHTVSAEEGGGATSFPWVSVNRNVFGPWETFTLEVQ